MQFDSSYVYDYLIRVSIRVSLVCPATNFHGSRSRSLTIYGVQGNLQPRDKSTRLFLCFSSSSMPFCSSCHVRASFHEIFPTRRARLFWFCSSQSSRPEQTTWRAPLLRPRGATGFTKNSREFRSPPFPLSPFFACKRQQTETGQPVVCLA